MADIEARFASHLYNKHDHDGAMSHYLATIGFLEPSFVIRKFLDAQRIHNLTSYLEALHDRVSHCHLLKRTSERCRRKTLGSLHMLRYLAAYPVLRIF